MQKALKPRAALVSLGCAKNLVDSEVMVSQLVNMGYEMTEDPSEASLIVVNTCGFLESAVQEAIETILDLSRYKTGGSCKHLVAAGCMVQRYGKRLPALMPEVDLFVGTEHCYDLAKILSTSRKDGARRLWISSPRFLLHSNLPRSLSTPFYTAYLKIAEGCSNRCSYCLIPHLRGPYRSRSIEDILMEAQRLTAEGVKEINLIAQDTTAFGSDLGDPNAIIRLIESLDMVDGIAWIRLLYAYPDRINTALLRTLAQSEKTVPYLDVPLQHSVPRLLKAMGRDAPSRDLKALIELIRLYLPESAIRTSFIVGFPGESTDDFEALVEFVETVEFDHVGVFAFSPEAGTRAARLPDQIEETTRKRRREILLAAQQPVSKRRLGLRLGKVVSVLVEGLHPETDLLVSGRIATQAPEVDGNVIITKGQADVGEIVSARITAVHDYDLEAEICDCSQLASAAD